MKHVSITVTSYVNNPERPARLSGHHGRAAYLDGQFSAAIAGSCIDGRREQSVWVDPSPDIWRRWAQKYATVLV